MVEITLQFTNADEFETELRGVIERIALADDTDLADDDYAETMQYVADQAVLAYDHKVLGWFLNGEHIMETNTQQ